MDQQDTLDVSASVSNNTDVGNNTAQNTETDPVPEGENNAQEMRKY